MVEPFGPFGIALVIFLAALTEFAGVLGPVVGHLAEGYAAVGRMVEPDAILQALA